MNGIVQMMDKKAPKNVPFVRLSYGTHPLSEEKIAILLQGCHAEKGPLQEKTC
jgi:hypothetical protein